MGKKKKKDAEPSKKELRAREAAIQAEIARRLSDDEPDDEPDEMEPVEMEPIDVSALGAIVISAEAPLPTPVDIDEPEPDPLESLVPKKSKKERKAAVDSFVREREESSARVDLAAADAELRKRIQAKRAAREAATKAAVMPDAIDGESEVDYQMRKLREPRDVVEKVAEAVDALRQATEAVETEAGRIFETGESVAMPEPVDFAKPSDATPELESGRLGYKIIQLGSNGVPNPRVVKQVTRVTTFVGNIDDETAIRNWEKRLLAEGLSSAPDDFIPRVNDIAHRRDVAIAKALKADRKGKLGIGEVGRIVKAAEKDAKAALDALVEEALELAGRNEKAHAGTDLHALTEIRDMQGIDVVRQMRERDEITDTQLASIEAYDVRMTRLDARILHSEAVIVNDSMWYAGRLDRVIHAKLPELVIGRGTANEYVRPADRTRRRYIADIKTGSLDYGAGKIARQLAAYALGSLYDQETGERSRHGAVRDVALVFHLPQGEGVCRVHPVDLRTGMRLLELSADVRRARNTGRKTIDTTVDIAAPDMTI